MVFYHNDMRWKNILYDSKKTKKFYLIDFEYKILQNMKIKMIKK